jgi:PadR family transcriptional regulator PadR
MTETGLTFYNELEKTWNELADAVQALTQPTEGNNNNQL